MYRAFFFLVLLSLVSSGAYWLSSQTGAVVVEGDGWRMSTSLSAMLAVLALGAALLVLATRLFTRLAGLPARMAARRRASRRRAGMTALARGLTAVAAGEGAEAQRLTRKARALLDEPVLTRLLAAQAAQLNGDDAEAERNFSEMMTSPDTQFLGLRGLFLQAQRIGDDQAARRYASRAFQLRPTAPWTFEAVFDAELRAGAWGAARAALDLAERSGAIQAPSARRYRAALLTADAEAAEAAGDEAAAAEEAASAAKLAPGFAPAALIAARRLSANGHDRRASRILETAFAEAPSAAIAAAYAGLKPGEKAQERAKRMRRLAAKAPQSDEARMVLSAQHAALEEWVEAEAVLAPLLAERPSARALRLRGDIARARYGARAAAAPWLAAAIDAPRSPDEGLLDAAAPRSADAWASLIRRYGETGALTPPALPSQPLEVDVELLEEQSQAELLQLRPPEAPAPEPAATDAPDPSPAEAAQAPEAASVEPKPAAEAAAPEPASAGVAAAASQSDAPPPSPAEEVPESEPTASSEAAVDAAAAPPAESPPPPADAAKGGEAPSPAKAGAAPAAP
ncbi:MAG: heme biosynthesis HemY N-terminal domain-containing protein [Pseudomonadota bacterium]